MSRPSQTNRELHARIGLQVRDARRRRRWSQEKLAEELNIQPETVSRYETGKVPLTLTMLDRTASALGISLETLLGLSTGTTVDSELAHLWPSLMPADQELVIQLARRLAVLSKT